VPPPAKKLLPLASFEIYAPSRQMILGFLAGWAAAIAMVAAVVWMVRG
jgi:hypothetical protein